MLGIFDDTGLQIGQFSPRYKHRHTIFRFTVAEKFSNLNYFSTANKEWKNWREKLIIGIIATP